MHKFVLCNTMYFSVTSIDSKMCFAGGRYETLTKVTSNDAI